MWFQTARLILRFRVALLGFLLIATVFMAWHASKVQLSFDFTRALPTDNPKYIAYQNFLKQFGSDGNTLVIGVNSKQFFQVPYFNAVAQLNANLKNVPGVKDVLSVPQAIDLKNDTINQQLIPKKIFTYPYSSQEDLEKDKAVFSNLPFYQSLLYNPITDAYLIAVTVDKDTINSKYRTTMINNIVSVIKDFEQKLKFYITALLK